MDDVTFLRMAAKADMLGVDTEGTGVELVADGRDYGVGISIAYHLGGPYYASRYFPYRHDSDNCSSEIQATIRDLLHSGISITCHNAKHDLHTLSTLGINPTGEVHCTVQMAHFINENFYDKSLDALCKKFLGEGKERGKLEEWTDIFGWGPHIPVELMSGYAAKDAELHLKLYWVLLAQLKEQQLDGKLWDYETRYTKLLKHMEQVGVRVDLDFCRKQLATGLDIMESIVGILSFKPSEPTALGPYLLEELGLPVIKRSLKTGKPSFDKEVMAEYEFLLEYNDNPAAKLILEYRGWQKVTSSFYSTIIKRVSPDGRVRPNFRQSGTKTGRSSCAKPNLQQIPRASIKPWNGNAKCAFLADDGFELWEIDYSQLEFRMGTLYAEEDKLLEIFEDDDRDIFDEMAIDLSMERFPTKTLTYTILYSGGGQRIATVFKKTLSEGEAIKEHFHKTYPGFSNCSRLAKSLAEKRGYVRYWTGRRRHLHREDSRKAFNSLMQGGAAELVKRKQLEVYEQLCGDNCRMVLQVHDSIWLEIRAEDVEATIAKAQAIMCDVPEFKVRLKTDAHKVGV